MPGWSPRSNEETIVATAESLVRPRASQGQPEESCMKRGQHPLYSPEPEQSEPRALRSNRCVSFDFLVPELGLNRGGLVGGNERYRFSSQPSLDRLSEH